MTISSILSILAYGLGGSLFVFLGITALSKAIPAFRNWISNAKIGFYVLAAIAFPSVLVMQILGRAFYVASSILRALAHFMLLHPWTAIHELRDIKDWDIISGRDA